MGGRYCLLNSEIKGHRDSGRLWLYENEGYGVLTGQQALLTVSKPCGAAVIVAEMVVREGAREGKALRREVNRRRGACGDVKSLGPRLYCRIPIHQGHSYTRHIRSIITHTL